MSGGELVRGAAEIAPRGSDLLHERHVRQPLVLRKQHMRLVHLRAKPLLQRCHHMRLGVAWGHRCRCGRGPQNGGDAVAATPGRCRGWPGGRREAGKGSGSRRSRRGGGVAGGGGEVEEADGRGAGAGKGQVAPGHGIAETLPMA
jgi:hypothetical protein